MFSRSTALWMQTLVVCIAIPLTFFSASAHGNKPHKKAAEASSTATQNVVSPATTSATASVSNAHDADHSHHHDSKPVLGEPVQGGFPTLHPLVVHFPIVLLMLVPLVQMVSLFTLRKELGFATLVLTLLGFVAAYLASTTFHAHVDVISDAAEAVLKQHDFYAEWTVRGAAFTLLLKLFSQFLVQPRFSRLTLPMEALVLLVAIATAVAVGIAGHHGAELVHIYGVGPQGNFLETH